MAYHQLEHDWLSCHLISIKNHLKVKLKLMTARTVYFEQESITGTTDIARNSAVAQNEKFYYSPRVECRFAVVISSVQRQCFLIDFPCNFEFYCKFRNFRPP